jgi:mono/diheme cytochrome c family protein
MAAKRNRIIVLLVYVLTTGAAAHYAQDSTMREVGRRDWAADMPDGEGKGLVLGACTQCHSLNSTVLQRKTAAAWGRTVRDMVARGAQLQPDEIDVITSYLAQSFGPEAPPLSPGEKPAQSRATSHPITAKEMPEGPAKAILLRACIRCHELDKIASARKNEAGWQASIKDMVRLGALVRPDETTVLVAYLAKHYGPQPQQATQATTADRSTATARASDPAQTLPDAEGKGLILGNCVQCHSIRYVTDIRKDAEGWRRTVNDMIARGTQITREEAEIIVRYLGEHRARR